MLAESYTLVQGQASFADAHTVLVGDRELTAARILVATGSRTAVPPVPGIDDVPWLDHVSALELERVPESLLVVGAGPVGLEFAQIFSRFGSRVTVVNHGAADRGARRRGGGGRAAGGARGGRRGVRPGRGVDSFRRDGETTVATVAGRDLRVTHVLLAAGRTPNTDGLALAAAGVETDRGFIVVDEHQRTTADGIWAAGDVAIGPMFTPTSQYQARIAVDDMFGVASVARSTARCRRRSSPTPSSQPSASRRPRRGGRASTSRWSSIRSGS